MLTMIISAASTLRKLRNDHLGEAHGWSINMTRCSGWAWTLTHCGKKGDPVHYHIIVPSCVSFWLVVFQLCDHKQQVRFRPLQWRLFTDSLFIN